MWYKDSVDMDRFSEDCDKLVDAFRKAFAEITDNRFDDDEQYINYSANLLLNLLKKIIIDHFEACMKAIKDHVKDSEDLAPHFLNFSEEFVESLNSVIKKATKYSIFHFIEDNFEPKKNMH